MTKDQSCAWKAKYFSGKIIPLQTNKPAKAIPCAGNPGTQITIEDLFFNFPSRKSALSNPADELKKIMYVIERYSIHYPNISFNVKRFGSSKTDLHTQGKGSVENNIKLIYGMDVGKNIHHFVFENEKLDYHMETYFTDQNYHGKKFLFLLFINGKKKKKKSCFYFY